MKRKRTESILQGTKDLKLEIKLSKRIKCENDLAHAKESLTNQEDLAQPTESINAKDEVVPCSEKIKEKQSESNEDQELSEYEKQRLINIRRNQAMLMSLNIETADSLSSVKKKHATRRPKQVKLKLQSVRRSARIFGKKTEVLQIVHDTPTAVTEERQSGPVDAVPWNDIEEADNQKFLNSLDMLSKSTKITANIVPEEMSFTER